MQQTIIISKTEPEKNYQLVEHLASGAQANVYLAQDIETQEHYALKISYRDEQNERISNIILKSRSLQKIVKIVNCWQNPESNEFYQVLELGFQNLYTYYNAYKDYFIKQPNITLDVIEQISLGLLEASKLDLIHRDIKPENIIIFCGQGNQINYKIGDFGSSRLQPKQANNMFQTHMVGTPMYMAPEMIDPNYKYSQKVDIWSLGCIWYFLASGSDMFESNMFDQLINDISQANQQQIDEKIDKLHYLDPQSKNLMKKLICVDPQHRLDAITLNEELQKLQIELSLSRQTNTQIQNLKLDQNPNSAYSSSNQLNNPYSCRFNSNLKSNNANLQLSASLHSSTKIADFENQLRSLQSQNSALLQQMERISTEFREFKDQNSTLCVSQRKEIEQLKIRVQSLEDQTRCQSSLCIPREEHIQTKDVETVQQGIEINLRGQKQQLDNHQKYLQRDQAVSSHNLSIQLSYLVVDKSQILQKDLDFKEKILKLIQRYQIIEQLRTNQSKYGLAYQLYDALSKLSAPQIIEIRSISQQNLYNEIIEELVKKEDLFIKHLSQLKEKQGLCFYNSSCKKCKAIQELIQKIQNLIEV